MSVPSLDPATLSIAAAAMMLMLAGCLLHFASHAGARKSVRLWSQSCLLAALGYLFKAFEPVSAPGPLAAVGDLTFSIVLIFQAAALADLTRHGERIVRILVVLTIAHLIVAIQFGGLAPNPFIRILSSQGIAAASLIVAALLGWRTHRSEHARLGTLISTTYALGGLILLATAVANLRTGQAVRLELESWVLLAHGLLHVVLPMAILALAHARLASQLAQSATVDPLTQASNRRGLADAWQLLQARARRGDEGWHVGVVMIDIDDFKKINHEHGHATGDLVLQLVVEVMRKTARRYDTVCRFGGQEFCMLLPGVTIRQAQVVTERIRARVAELGQKRAGIDVTVSAGITVANAGQTAMDQAIDAADQMLYAAKRDGPDRARVDPDALRVIAGLAPVERTGKPDELGFPMV